MLGSVQSSINLPRHPSCGASLSLMKTPIHCDGGINTQAVHLKAQPSGTKRIPYITGFALDSLSTYCNVVVDSVWLIVLMILGFRIPRNYVSIFRKCQCFAITTTDVNRGDAGVPTKRVPASGHGNIFCNHQHLGLKIEH